MDVVSLYVSADTDTGGVHYSPEASATNETFRKAETPQTPFKEHRKRLGISSDENNSASLPFLYALVSMQLFCLSSVASCFFPLPSGISLLYTAAPYLIPQLVRSVSRALSLFHFSFLAYDSLAILIKCGASVEELT